MIDLSDMSFIDSKGLKALLDVWRAHTTAGLELAVREPSQTATPILKIAGLADRLAHRAH